MRRIIPLILSLFFILTAQCAPMMYRDYWEIPPEISDYGVWDIAVDGPGNVYIIGTRGDNQTDEANYVVIKYDSSGEELWSRMYNGPAGSKDFVTAIALDGPGNVYVTGCSMGALHEYVRNKLAPTYDYATVKYDKDGNQLWVARYDAFGEDYAVDMAIDHAGNVYVTGVSDDSSRVGPDYVTIKYDTNGDELWVARYEEGEPSAIAVDDYGNAYVTGNTHNNAFATIKYDKDGNQLWVVGPIEGNDIAVDEAGNAYVTGSSLGLKQSYKLVTIKYSMEGNELWKAIYQGLAVWRPEQIVLDARKNIYITGTSHSSDINSNYLTIKYNDIGQEEWVAKYGGVCGSKDEANAMAVDIEGNVYVTGAEIHGLRMARFFNWWEKVHTWGDFVTVKYDASGEKQWTARVSGKGSGYTSGKAIAVDDIGNVYVTGNGRRYVDWRTVGDGPISWFTTIKYNANGEQQWLARY